MPLEIFKGLFKRSAPEPSSYSHQTSRPEAYRSGKRDNRLLSDEEIRAQAFSELRESTHAEMERRVVERIRTNPHPMEEEINIGAFVETIEPQVRDAVLTFRRKGYNTRSSGFGWFRDSEIPDAQIIGGSFSLNGETKEKLKRLSVEVKEKSDEKGVYNTQVIFEPNAPDLSKIKQQWDNIADIIPDKGYLAYPSSNGGALEFRRLYIEDITPALRQTFKAMSSGDGKAILL